mgnify:CR=1 FL=1
MRGGLRQGGSSRKNSNFAEDGSDPPHLRAALKDFAGSGFDRGHLVAAAAVKFDQSAQDETFLLSNISPQEPSPSAAGPALPCAALRPARAQPLPAGPTPPPPLRGRPRPPHARAPTAAGSAAGRRRLQPRLLGAHGTLDPVRYMTSSVDQR